MFPLKFRKLHKSTSRLTCSMCPVWRVELRHSSSHTSTILRDNQPAHHNQSHNSHIWTEKPTQQALKALQSCHTCFILPPGDPALLWPMANHSCDVSMRNKLQSCPWLEVLKCIIHQVFWEMLTAQFAPGIIHLLQYVTACWNTVKSK